MRVNSIKHIAIAAAASAAMLLGTPSSQAGSIDYLSNQSGQFIGNFAKNASTRGADTAFYNPAGMSLLKKKLYINISTQTVFKDFWITYKGEEFHSDAPTPIVPSLVIAGKPLDDLAIWGAFSIPAGGGSLTYEKGVPFLRPLALVAQPTGSGPPRNGFFEGSSIFYGATIGAAYKFLDDMISISAAARLVIAQRTYYGYATYDSAQGETTPVLDAAKDAIGVAGIFGVHIRPIEYLDIALRFETETSLNHRTTSNLNNNNADGTAKLCTAPAETNCDVLNTDQNAVSSFRDGAEEKRNLPMVLGAGLSIHPIPDLDINLAFNYYFVNEADELEDRPFVTVLDSGFVRGFDDDYTNGFDIAGSVAYRFIPEFELTLGYNYTDIGANENTWNDFEYSMNSHSFGFSARASVHEQVDITLGFSATVYDEGRNNGINEAWNVLGGALGDPDPEGETFNREVFALGFGIEWAPDI